MSRSTCGLRSGEAMRISMRANASTSVSMVDSDERRPRWLPNTQKRWDTIINPGSRREETLEKVEWKKYQKKKARERESKRKKESARTRLMNFENYKNPSHRVSWS